MKIQKQIVFALLAMTLCGTAAAKPVDSATAIGVAGRILKGTELKATMLTNEIYLVTPVDGAGYVLVSADDCVIPVLAYSEEEPFQTTGMPENVQSWLDGYSGEIAWHIAAGTAQSPEVAAMWQGTPAPKEAPSSIAALMSTRWNQNPLYNNLCPSNSSGQAVAGCVAIATAQVMKYWNHPLIGHGSHSYTCGTFGILSANFQTEYQWPRMPNALGWGSTSNQVNAVATLAYHVGVAVEMNYGVNSSGSHVLAVGGAGYPSTENALKSYFRYSPRMHGVHKVSYTDSQWDSIMIQEISHSRPVIYVGYDNDGGHAFVIDGYRATFDADGHRYFHVNWGWGGSNDGYYTLNNLAPGSGGAGGGSYVFTSNNAALIGIEPAHNSEGDNVVVVDVAVLDSTMGHVSGNGRYTPYTDTIRVMAIAAPGHRFVHWTSGSTANPVEFVTSGDFIDTAVFEPITGDTLGYCTDLNEGPVRTRNGDTIEWAIRIPADLRSSQRSITGVQFYAYGSGRYFINVHQGDTVCLATRLYSKYNILNGQTWYTIEFDSAITVDNTRPLWIAVRNNGADYIYPIGYSTYSGNSDGCWIRRDGHWITYDSAGFYGTWMIRTILAERDSAQFAVEVGTKYFIDTVDVDLPAECSVSGSGIFDEGATATVTATTGGGMHFWYWVTSNFDTIYDNPHTFAVDYAVTYTAVYAPYAIGIDDVDSPALHLTVNGRMVDVAVPEDTEVRAYDMQGRQVAEGRRFCLPSAGVYIVRAGAAVKMIVIL